MQLSTARSAWKVWPSEHHGALHIRPQRAHWHPNFPSCLTAWTCIREIWLFLSFCHFHSPDSSWVPVSDDILLLKNLFNSIFGISCFRYISHEEHVTVCHSISHCLLSLLLVSVGFRLICSKKQRAEIYVCENFWGLWDPKHNQCKIFIIHSEDSQSYTARSG